MLKFRIRREEGAVQKEWPIEKTKAINHWCLGREIGRSKQQEADVFQERDKHDGRHFELRYVPVYGVNSRKITVRNQT